MALLAPLRSKSQGRRKGPSIARSPVRREGLLFAALVAAVALMATSPSSFASGAQFSEHQVKAAFIVNFARYVEWPAEAFPTARSPFVIAAPENSKVADEIQKLSEGRAIKGRSIQLKRFDANEDPGAFHILFATALEQHRLQEILAKPGNVGVLTVGESDSFLKIGGMINMRRRDQRIALDINLAAAQGAQIHISSQLLSVANVVHHPER